MEEKRKGRSRLQVQPTRKEWEGWKALAEREGITFEVLEISMPPVMAQEELRAEAAAWYRASGLVTSVHGNFIDVNPASADPEIRRVSRQRCRESCEAARAMGVREVVFHCSHMAFLSGGYTETWAGGCAEFYAELAEEYDLGLKIENSADPDPAALRALMTRIRDPRIGVCLDVGHTHYTRTPMEEWFGELGEWIGYLHLSDNGGKYDDHLILGKGTVDWKKADGLWRQLGKDVPMTVEMGKVSDAETSIAYLKEEGYFGC